MSPPEQGSLSYRMQQLEERVEEQKAEIAELRKTMYGAGYKIAGAIVVASLTFAVSVIRLLG